MYKRHNKFIIKEFPWIIIIVINDKNMLKSIVLNKLVKNKFWRRILY